MKNSIKKFFQFCVAGCMFTMILLLCGCSDKTASITDKNSSTISTTDFTVSIYDKYKINEEESAENEKYFEATEPVSILHVYDTTAGNASIEAFVEFCKSIMAEAYGISDNQINAEACQIENHSTCYYMTYKYTYDGHDYTAASYMIYEDGSLLILTEASYSADEQNMKSELAEMAKTVNYTGDYHLPQEDEYPFSVENPYVRVTVNKGFDSTQAVNVSNEEKNIYTTDSNMISVRYTAADNYDKGLISVFEVEHLDKDISVSDQADKMYKGYLNGDKFEDVSFEEVKLGDVWPDKSDITAYKVCVNDKETNYSAERYYFQISDENFCIDIAYPFEDFGTRDELYKMFCDVEFR